MDSKKKLTESILIIAIILSNISQIPSLFGNPIIKSGYALAWMLLFAILLFRKWFGFNMDFLIPPVIFDMLCLLGWAFGKDYMASSLFVPINMSAFILTIGFLFGALVDEQIIKKIAIAYIASSIIVGGVLYVTVFRGIDWSGSSTYVYASKNSAAQFLLVGLILVATLFYVRHRIASGFLIIAYAVLIFMMKSRATIAALAIYLIYFIFFIVVSKRERNFYLFLVVIFGLVVVFNPDANHLIIQEIIFNNRGTDMTTLSSGRDLHWKTFRQEFGKYLFWGTGGTYLESMPLAVLMSYGVIGGVPILLFALKPLIYAIKNMWDKRYRIYSLLVVSISLTMLVNSIFEEQAPFGPGVKCYFLWLLFGMYIGKKQYDLLNNYNEEINYNE